MGTPRIRDIPSLKKTLDDIHSLQQLRRVFPLLKPFLRAIGVDVGEIEASIAQLDTLADSMASLASLPDRFNDLFASRGWIMYDAMNVEIAQAAVTRAESGDVAGAEQDLVDYYDEQTIRWGLMRMNAVQAFRPRMRLAELAFVDYLNGRYHAAIPVTLAVLDGMVNELGPRGFFAEGVNLEAWDSIAAHSTGLATLSKLLGQSRTKTTSDPIAVPYRHGILHGLDLSYDSRMVAAKAWGALFAARDWALKVERNELNETMAPPPPTWRDLLHQIRENAEDKARLQQWKPRAINLGVDIPASGSPDEYEDQSPERSLVEFMTNWSGRNFGYMARYVPRFVHHQEGSSNKTAGELRRHFDDKRLKSFEMLELRDEGPAVTVIKTKLGYDESGVEQERIVDLRLIYQDETGNTMIRGKPSGAWRIVGYLV